MAPSFWQEKVKMCLPEAPKQPCSPGEEDLPVLVRGLTLADTLSPKKAPFSSPHLLAVDISPSLWCSGLLCSCRGRSVRLTPHGLCFLRASGKTLQGHVAQEFWERTTKESEHTK